MTTYALRLGGLGNQLFQLAAAIGLDPAGDGRLIRDRDQQHAFDVEDLAPGLFAACADDEVSAVLQLGADDRFQQPLRDLPAAFAPAPGWDSPPVLLSGYFQHPDWYRVALAKVVDGLIAAAPAGLSDRLGGRPAVYVRGGDYIRLGRELSLQFYVRAAKAMTLDDAVVVSADAERGAVVATVLTVAGHRTSPPLRRSTALDDFWALATAPSVIMANSTFAWWAVQVGDELYRRAGRSRVVAAPKEWILGHGTELLESRWLAVS